MIKIAIFNQKGGVAKTTTTINIAAALEKYFKKKVLAVNCDSQTTLHQFFFTYNSEDVLNKGTVKDLFEGKPALDIATQVYIPEKNIVKPSNIYVIPSTKDIYLWDANLKKGIKQDINNAPFDYCIFDLPPHLSGISLAALSVCDYVIVPAIPDMDSLLGFDDLVNTIKNIRNSGENPDLSILGILFCKVESYMTHKYIMDSIREEMHGLCFDTYIKNRSIMEQARFYSAPICYYSPNSEPASGYHQLAAEIERKIKKLRKG